jgi:hypothetical protein
LRELKTTFKKYSVKLSPEKREEWKAKFTDEGLFELREQTAQVRRSPTPLPPASPENIYGGAVWKYALFGEHSHLVVAICRPNN